MLDLASPPRVIAGLVLFPDHADPSRWYAAGGRVRPARAGALRLDVFRGGAGGAFLQVELTVDPDEDALSAARLELGAQATLVPIDWVAAEVWVAGRLGEDDVSRSVGQPGTAGSTTTVVAARVDEALARVLVAALTGDAVPAVVGYHLEGEGLAPALEAEIEADMGAIYDAFAAQGALTTPIGRARVLAMTEELEKSGAIRVHVVDGAGNDVRAAALQRFGEDLVRLAFRPAGLVQLAPTLDAAMAQVELQVKLSWRRDAAEQDFRWSYRERTARRFSHFVSASLLDWAPDPRAAIHEHDVEADVDTLSVVAVGRFAEVTVELDAPVGAVVTLVPEAARAEVLLAPGAREGLRYRVTTRFAEGAPVDGDTCVSDWIEAAGALTLVVDPAVVHGLWSARFEVLGSGTGIVGVDLRVFRGEREARGHAFTFASPGWRVARKWHYEADELEDEADVLPGINLLRPPTREVETRVVVVADEGLEAVELVVTAEDRPSWRRDLSLTPSESADLRLVVPRDGPERWRWDATSVYSDGRVRETEGGPARVLVLGAPEGVRTLTAVLLLPPEAQGFAAVTFDARAGDHSAHAWLDGTATDAVLTFPASAPRSWTLVVEGLRTDGTRASTRFEGDQDVVVVPPFPS